MTHTPGIAESRLQTQRKLSAAHRIGLCLAGAYLVGGLGRVLWWITKDPLAVLILPVILLDCGILYFAPRVLGWAFREVVTPHRRLLAASTAFILLLGAGLLLARLGTRVVASLVGPTDKAFSGFVGVLLRPAIKWDPVVRSIVTEGCRISPQHRLTVARQEAAAPSLERASGSFAFLFDVPQSAARNLGRDCLDRATQEVLLGAKDPWVRAEVVNNSHLDPSLCGLLTPNEIALHRASRVPTCGSSTEYAPSLGSGVSRDPD